MRRIILFFAVALIALVVWWLRPRGPQLTTTGPQLTQQAKPDAPVAPIPSAGVVVTPEDLAQTPWKGTDEQKRARIAEVRDIARQANQPISFYGKVVDQDNVPLPGVKVRMGVKHTQELLPGTTRDVFDYVEQVTDGQGLFNLIGKKGALVGIESMEKPGYEAPYLVDKTYWYWAPVPGLRHTPIPNAPVIFRMWKLQGAGELITADKFYGVVPDGRIYAIDMLGEKKTEGGNTGDFKVSIRRPAQVSSAAKYDWSCTIEGIGGGVIETQDEFMYRAPESGYQSRYEVNVSANDPQWSDRAKRQLYLKSREGKVYARLDVEILTNYQDKAVFSVKYHANPNSSRNLEYDPAQNLVPDLSPRTTTAPKP